MRILFITHAFNSLAQRLFVELGARGHEVSIEFDIADAVAEEAVALFAPDLIVAPYLRRALPESIWARHVCLIVHPGIVGDRGPSALDWAIMNDEREWGVTVLQANGEMDAGDIWASAVFPMRVASKSSLYRNEVTEAALRALLAAVERFQDSRRPDGFRPLPLASLGADERRGQLRPLLRQEQRAIDWQRDSTSTVLRKIAAADGFPGVRDELFGAPCFLHDAHAEPNFPLDRVTHAPGQLIARQPGAVGGLLRATVDGAVWIGHVRRPDTAHPFKLPATLAFAAELARCGDLPEIEAGRADIRYEECGAVGYLSFEFYNGAMSTAHCECLLTAYRAAVQRPTRVIVLLGGSDFWSNGIHLNMIEAAESCGSTPADESWRNINAMNDLAQAVLETTSHLTVAALRGNAGAGGVFLALAADAVWARVGVVLNPHYRNMGNLYGSEYWTYSLPRRVGADMAQQIVQRRLPLGAAEAQRIGLIDACFGADSAAFERELRERAGRLAGATAEFTERLSAKRQRFAAAEKPLATYRAEELAQMQRNFYGFDPSYHVARYHFVFKLPHAWTPRHLARHRDLKA